MPNMERILMNNKQKGTTEERKEAEGCNCRRKAECPLEGKCKAKEVVYQAVVEADGNKESYVGITEKMFKTRFGHHKQSFTNRKKATATELSKYIWDLKDKGIQYELSWSILSRAAPYSNVTKRCNLCNLEKYYITYEKQLASLNKRTELFGPCRHNRKYLLENVT